MVDNSGGIVRSRRCCSDDGGPGRECNDGARSSLCHLALLELLLEHGLPNPPPSVCKPVFELLLVDASLLHEHDLILWRGVWVSEVLG